MTASPVPQALPDFNPISPEFLENPDASLARARTENPVFFAPEFGFWVILPSADIDKALTDWQTFSSGSLADVPVPDEYADRVPPGFFATGALVSQDPPEHTRRRSLINRGFVRGRMLALAEPIEAICNNLIDEFIADGHCELMSQYCYEVSLRSIVLLMGMPTDDLPRLRQLVDDHGAAVSDAVRPMSDEERRERWGRIAGVRDYLSRTAEQRRAQPGEDLVSAMATATAEDGTPTLTADDIVTHLTELLFAGTDTTANLMASVVRLLDRHPDQLAALRADPSLWPAAVEEGVRIRPPANGIFRITTTDVTVAGVTIPARSLVWVALASANHDPAKFDSPEVFDISRANLGDHASFGKGRHFCMGAPLARTEAPIGLRVLYERLPNLRVVADQSIEFDPNIIVVLLKRLLVTW
jgi:cytochrome P450